MTDVDRKAHYIVRKLLEFTGTGAMGTVEMPAMGIASKAPLSAKQSGRRPKKRRKKVSSSWTYSSWT